MLSRILIVEDEYPARERLVSYLRKIDLNIGVIDIANNGCQALSKLRSNFPDVIITDIHMPQINGLELIQEVRKVDQQVPIIVLSCHESFQYAQELLRLGITDYLIKDLITPIDLYNVLSPLANDNLHLSNSQRDNCRNKDNHSEWFLACYVPDKGQLEKIEHSLEQLIIAVDTPEVHSKIFKIVCANEDSIIVELIERLNKLFATVFFGLSSQSGSVKEARDALEYSRFYDRHGIVRYSMIRAYQAPLPADIYLKLHTLEEALEDSDGSTVMKLVNELFRFKLSGIMGYYLASKVVGHLAEIAHGFCFRNQTTISAVFLDVQNPLDQIDLISSSIEYSHLFSNLFVKLIAVTSTTDEQLNISPFVLRSIEIINYRYQEPLSLESVAIELGIHPVHLSRIFKSELNINFKRYLNRRCVPNGKIYTSGIGYANLNVVFPYYECNKVVYWQQRSITDKKFIFIFWQSY